MAASPLKTSIADSSMQLEAPDGSVKSELVITWAASDDTDTADTNLSNAKGAVYFRPE